MVTLETLSYLSTAPDQFIDITEDVHAAIERSSVTNGLAAIILSHTTCGIVVNEGLPCVETDLMETLDRIAPLDAPYAHAHSCGHIKSMICGNSCFFPVQDGHIVCGGAQNIYLAEFDGPQKRKVYVEVLGE